MERSEAQLEGSLAQLEGAGVLLEGFEAQLEGSEGQLRGGQTNERTDGKSPHSTGLRPLPGPLPKKQKWRRFPNLPILQDYVPYGAATQKQCPLTDGLNDQ